MKPTKEQERTIRELNEEILRHTGIRPITYASSPTPDSTRWAFQTYFCDGGTYPTGPDVETNPGVVIARLHQIVREACGSRESRS